MSDQPNVLFFLTDDQRFDTLAALGNRRIHTPNLDALTARGTTFTHAHIMGGTCGAICMPSRAMLHTGRTLFHIDESGLFIRPEHTMMGEAFRAAGYETFGSGKWHNGCASYARSFTDGDEIFFGGMADHWNVPAYHFDPTGKYESRLPYCPNPFANNEVRQRHADHIHAGEHSTDIIARAGCEFLGRRDRGKPFFAYLSFLAPHDPRTMPRKYLDLYDPATIELPPNFMPAHPFEAGSEHERDEHLEAFPRTPDAIRRHTAEYYAMISHVDDRIGDVIAALKASGEYDNTIIVFAGDNGLALGRHGLMGKQNLYDHSMRVPLMFAGPGVQRGQCSDSYCYLVDVFATLCDLTGVNRPASVEGISLKPAIDNVDCHVRDTVLCAYIDRQRSVRDDRYKLIEYVVNGRRTTQLFDVRADPWELTNLVDAPAHADDVARLRRELHRWRDELGDTANAFWAAIN